VQPWALKKQPGKEQDLQDACTVALNLYRQLVVYLSPVLPKLAEDTAVLLGDPLDQWSKAREPLSGVSIRPFEHLMSRVDPKKVQAIVAASSSAEEDAARNRAPDAAATEDDDVLAQEPLAAECTIDDFSKVDLRVARVLSAELVPTADRLLKLTVSLGGSERRTVFAGIKAAYDPQRLVGRLVVVVANLKPRKMKFGTSEGMVIAAGPGEKDVFLLSPDPGAKPGQRVH
jgi:methionyl-tRNA synthetase